MRETARNLGEPVGIIRTSGKPLGESQGASDRFERGRHLFGVVIDASLAAHGRSPIQDSTEKAGAYMLYGQPPFTDNETAAQVAIGIEKTLTKWRELDLSGNPLQTSEMDEFTPITGSAHETRTRPSTTT